MQKNIFTPEKRHIDDIKRDLPPVCVRFNGKQYWARVSGRKNRSATVSPFQLRNGDKLVKTICGPCFKFSWEAVCRSVVSGVPLNCEEGAEL